MVFYPRRAGLWRIVLLMNIAPYPFVRTGNTYKFISTGKKVVQKVVDFSLLKGENSFNLGFGDLLPDGSIDDMVNTNNGDLVKTFATVVAIAVDFLEHNPHTIIYFTGSTESRTNLYAEILRRNYLNYKEKYVVFASLWVNDKLVDMEFDPAFDGKYFEYYLYKRK